MASTIKVDKIEGSTGTTITVPTGQTFTVTDGLAIGSIPTITVAKGGTNTTSYTTGDVLYASGATTLTKLAKGTAEQVLSMNSGETAPEWTTAAPTAGGTGQTTWAVGDLLYANGVNTLTKLTKPASTMNLQMTSAGVPSWAAAAGGGTTYLATETASDDNIVTFDGDFTSAYDTYLINCHHLKPTTNNTSMSMRVRVSSSDVSSSDYYGCETGNKFTTTSTQILNGGKAQDNAYMTWGVGMSDTATFEGSFQMWLYNPLSTTDFKTYQWRMNWPSEGSAPSSFNFNCAAGYCRTTSALTGVSFSYGGFGNNVNTGIFQLFGYKNS